MRARVLIALIAGLSTAGAAQAGDRLVPKRSTSLLNEGYIGQPFWSLLASCAGQQGAAHAYFASKGRAKQAEIARLRGVEMLNLAVDRLVVDRSIDRAAALDLAMPAVELGRKDGAQTVRGVARWDAVETSCAELSEASRGAL